MCVYSQDTACDDLSNCIACPCTYVHSWHNSNVIFLPLCVQVIVKAMSEVKVHLFVQLYTFVLIPVVLYVIVHFLVATAMLDQTLSEG